MVNNHGPFFCVQHSRDVIPKPPNMSKNSSLIPTSIHSGDDLIFKIDDTFHPCCVIDILNCTNQNELLVNIWAQEIVLQDWEEKIEALDVIKYCNVNGMPKVERSNWIKWVTDDAMFDHLYIFHCDTIQYGLHATVHIMSNTYFTQFKSIYTKQKQYTCYWFI